MPLLVFLFIFSEVLVLLSCSCTVVVTSKVISRFAFLPLARLCEQHPVPSLGFGLFFFVVASHEHSTGQILSFCDKSCWLSLVLFCSKILFCRHSSVHDSRSRSISRIGAFSASSKRARHILCYSQLSLSFSGC
jgi:hypothetical protein